MTPKSVSAVIITKNERANIDYAISSLAWADEVLLLDSGSSDGTPARGRELGARVVHQDWLGFSQQRNRAAEVATHDWVFQLDADEIVTAELAASIKRVLAAPEHHAYAADRRGDFLGVLLPNEARASKRKRFIRLYDKTKARFDDSMNVHEEVRFEGEPGELKGALLHWNGHTMDEFFTLFNRYAGLESAELNRLDKRASALDILLRPILRFGWSYLVKGGWRLGTRGLMHSMLKATSDYMRYAKLWELQNVSEPQPFPPAELFELPHGIEFDSTEPDSAEPELRDIGVRS